MGGAHANGDAMMGHEWFHLIGVVLSVVGLGLTKLATMPPRPRAPKQRKTPRNMLREFQHAQACTIGAPCVRCDSFWWSMRQRGDE